MKEMELHNALMVVACFRCAIERNEKDEKKNKKVLTVFVALFVWWPEPLTSDGIADAIS